MKHIVFYVLHSAFLFLAFGSLYGQSTLLELPAPLYQNTDNEEIVVYDHKVLFNRVVSSRDNQPVTFDIPVFGEKVTFTAQKNQVWNDEDRKIASDIYTFDIVANDNKSMTGSLTISPYGLHVLILHNGRMVTMRPEIFGKEGNYIIEYGVKPDLSKYKSWCGHDHSLDGHLKNNLFNPLRNNFQNGELRKTYNLAIVVTGEYYLANGNNNNIVRNKVIADVNAISAIFRAELSVTFALGGRITLFNDPATDPFIPGQERTQQAANAVADAYPNQNNYHVGHVFHIHADGDGWQNGGVALLRSVCKNDNYGSGRVKGGGWSGAYDNTSNGWISLATHEFGHQFGAQHTFNGIGESCTDAISLNNAYEIGSGTTIMSYQGICQEDNNIPSSGVLDNYFHYASLFEMYNYITNDAGNTCGSSAESNNQIPRLDANFCSAPQLTIPRNTPFYLDAFATDGDDDPLTYSWEQFNEDGPGKDSQGDIGVDAANSLVAPLFRSFPPTTESDRYFPSMSVLRSASGSSEFEVLPNRPRVLKFVVTVRDNNTAGSAINTDELDITISSSGPFAVDFPKGGENITTGTPTQLRWLTNGTQALCNNVRIKLSLDGGVNFNITLAENVPYSAGVLNYTFPVNFPATSNARILIECMDYDCIKFFNISRDVFTLTSGCSATESYVCPDTPVIAEAGSPESNLNVNAVDGFITSSISATVNSASPTMRVAVRNTGTTSCVTIPNVIINVATKRFRVEKAGTYNFRRSPGGSGWISIFRASNFNMNNPCSGGSFVGSSAEWSGPDVGNGTNVLPFSFWSINLDACTEYVMVFYSYSALPTTIIFSEITGPGSFYELNSSANSNFGLTHVAVDIFTGIIAAHHPTGDFSGLAEGYYGVFSLRYKTGGATPPDNINPDDLIGQAFFDVQNSDCARFSTNFRLLQILSACSITDIVAGAQTPCVVATNAYTQEVVITYDQAPTTGQISVNGQLFDITSSPQTVVLTNLDSDGLPVSVNAFFTDLPDCSLLVPDVFTAPVNCCPISFDLGGSREVCAGLPVILNAGNDGATYAWSVNGSPVANTTNTLTATLSGVYSVTVTHSSGCTKSQSVSITFVNPPTVVLPENFEICENETFTLTPNINGNFTEIEWFRNNTLISGENGISLEITQGGSYRIEVTNNTGCMGSDAVVVTVLSNPVVNLGNDVINVCEGIPVVLNAGNTTLSHVWLFDGNIIAGATNPTYTVPDGQSGRYRAIVRNSADCEGFDEVTVNFFQSPTVNMPSSIDICQGETAVIIAVLSGFDSYVWKRDNVIFTPSNGLIHSTTLGGVYTVEATNLGGCTTPGSTLVTVNPLPVVDLGSDIVACIGNTVNLNAGTGGAEYVWTRNNVAINENNSTIAVTTAGNYAVTVTSSDDCSASDAIMVSFVPGPTVEAGPDITICEGETRTITAVTSATNITWLYNGVPVENQTTTSITVTDPGVYTIAVIGGPNNCEARDEFRLTVNPKPLINIGSDQTICQGESITLDAGAGSGLTYRWTRDNVSVGMARTLVANTNGTYRVTVTSGAGCTGNDEMVLTVSPNPSLELEEEISICDNQPKTIMPMTNGTSFQWFKDGVLLQGQTQKDLVVSNDGVYRILVRNAANCEITDSVIVTSRPSPTVSLPEDITLCPDNDLALNAGAQNQYIWSTGETTRIVMINSGKPATIQSTTYSVTVTNSFGCTDTDNIVVTTRPIVKASIVSSAPGICSGNPVTLTAQGGDTFEWTDPTGTLSATNSQEVVASPTNSTTYSVIVGDVNCPDNTDTVDIMVNVFAPVNVSAGQDTSVIKDKKIKLNASGGRFYQWDNTDLIQGSATVPNPEIKITENTVFTVTITDINGCEYVDSVFVRLLEDPLSSFVAVSIITPNNDGDNDFLEFIGLEAFPKNTLRIYNRWGNVVFEGFNYQTEGELFDGTRNGERLPPDTYYYILTFEDQIFKSALTIIWD